MSNHRARQSSIFDNVWKSGPLISPAAKEKVSRLIGSVADEGGTIHLDGRGIKVPGYEDGNFVGPSVVEGTVTMEAYKCVPDPRPFLLRTADLLHTGLKSSGPFSSV